VRFVAIVTEVAWPELSRCEPALQVASFAADYKARKSGSGGSAPLLVPHKLIPASAAGISMVIIVRNA